MERHLFIVARQRPDVYAVLSREFAREREVEVILDRRIGDRRQGEASVPADRRQAERRSFQERANLATHGFGVAPTSGPFRIV